MVSKRQNKIFYLFLLFIMSNVFAYYNFQNRDYSWDMPGYIGSYYQIETQNNEQKILDNVYNSIKIETSGKQFSEVVGNYKKDTWLYEISKNAKNFNSQIPYYSIKVLYGFLIFCFVKIGFSPPVSVFLPNLISFYIFGFLLFSIFLKILKNNYFWSFSITILILIAPFFRDLAISPSPDMLVTLLITWFFYTIIRKDKIFNQSLILMLIVLCRPDFIIFVLTYLGSYFHFQYFKNKKFEVAPIIFTVIILSSYFLILKISHYPGWKDVFFDSFIQRRLYVSGNANFTFQEYWSVLSSNILNFKKITVLAVIFFITIISFSKNLCINILAIIFFANIYLKFLFFPAAGEYRFFIPFLLILFILTLKVLYDKVNQSTSFTN